MYFEGTAACCLPLQHLGQHVLGHDDHASMTHVCHVSTCELCQVAGSGAACGRPYLKFVCASMMCALRRVWQP